MGHLFIIILITVLIFILQISVFISTQSKLNILKTIFPQNVNKPGLLERDKDSGDVVGISISNTNPVFKVIISSINRYLKSNHGRVSDFHIIKDIVDRNCDSKEEEISTQIPIPLYFGLMGTMAGILTGVGLLLLSGALNDLLGNMNTGKGVEGVTSLLGGVALAMFSSVFGIIFTTYASNKLKNSKAVMERSKNEFLSWIQAKLLPELSNSTAEALQRMTENLALFNNTFSENTNELRETLSLVNESYRGQAQVISSINELRINEIATANINVYEKLKGCTKEIGQFATYLQDVNNYIANVNALNDKLDQYETRTRAIEDMGVFFINERSNMERWNAVVSKNVEGIQDNMVEWNNTINDVVGQAQATFIHNIEGIREQIAKGIGGIGSSLLKTTTKLENQFSEGLQDLNSDSDKYINIFRNAITTRTAAFEKALEDERSMFETRVQELQTIIDELKNISSVKESMEQFSVETRKQNKKLEELIDAITSMPQVQATGAAQPAIRQQFMLSKWMRITGVALVSLLALPGLRILIDFIKSLF